MVLNIKCYLSFSFFSPIHTMCVNIDILSTFPSAVNKIMHTTRVGFEPTTFAIQCLYIFWF